MKHISPDITQSHTLAGELYKSAEFFEKSKEAIFARTWQLSADADVVKLPDYAHPFYFMDGFIDEPLLLTRDKDDAVHCLSNVCTHRGNILIESPCVLNSSGIVCSYHGKRFDACGKFKSMPETDGMKNFPTEKDNLTQVPIKKWKQFLFTSLNPQIKFEELIKEMDERVGWMPIENFVFDAVRSREYLVKANWMLYCDNYLEGFHIPFIHKELAKSLDYNSYKSELYKYGNLQLANSSGGEMAFDLPKDSPDYGKNVAAYYFWLFPNTMLNFYPWGLSINIVKPVAVNLTKVIYKTYVWDYSKIESGAGAALDRVEREDEAIVERVQKGVSSRFYERGRFSPKMEKGVHHFHSLVSQLTK
jgi:choline monooxygenase